MWWPGLTCLKAVPTCRCAGAGALSASPPTHGSGREFGKCFIGIDESDTFPLGFYAALQLHRYSGKGAQANHAAASFKKKSSQRALAWELECGGRSGT